MEIPKGIEMRQSIWACNPNPIGRDVMQKILQSVRKNPSYTDTQSREVVVSGLKNEEEAEKQ